MFGESQSYDGRIKYQNMIETFKSYLEALGINHSDRILIAVSGGIDSVTMADLFSKTPLQCGIAHCNFQLRGAESDQDAQFVAQLAQTYDYPLYHISFNTATYAQQNHISIQMAARKLRYEWLEQIRNNDQFDYIAIGHNSDDAVETSLINMMRGTGIRGLTGIKAKDNKIIRPLLFASREAIRSYCEQEQVTYREDSSNQTLKYARNKIRHQLIPLFEELNPRFKQTMLENIERLSEARQIVESSIQQVKAEVVRHNQNIYAVHIPKLRQYTPVHLYLYEILKEFGFNQDQINTIGNNLTGEPGKQFFSSQYRLVKDRDELLITPLYEKQPSVFYIDETTHFIQEPIPLAFNRFDRPSQLAIPNDPSIAWIDRDQIQFPLIIKKQEKGDKFIPLGVHYFQKISDYMTDHKFSLIDKEQTWLLCNEGQIVWIIGHRLDERYKVTEQTSSILEIKHL